MNLITLHKLFTLEVINNHTIIIILINYNNNNNNK